MQHNEIGHVNFDGNFPDEMWLKVFSYLGPEYLLLIALVNTRFKDISRNNFL